MLKKLTQAGMLLIVLLIGQSSFLATTSQPDLAPPQARGPTISPTNTPFMPLPTSISTLTAPAVNLKRASISEDNPLTEEPGAPPEELEVQASEVLLPDLRTLPPSDLYINYYPWSRRKFIRFSVEIANIGPGILELLGHREPGGEGTHVHQQLFSEDGALVDDPEIGEFIYHPGHFHIHLGEFALYDLWSVKDDFTLDTVVSTGGKVSYCVRDMYKVDFELESVEIPGKRAYTRCDAGTQGLSPGWIDLYVYYLPGQLMEITGLPNGVYAVVSTVNPNKSLRETNLYNNAGVTYFSLQDFKAIIIPGQITQGSIEQ